MSGLLQLADDYQEKSIIDLIKKKAPNYPTQFITTRLLILGIYRMSFSENLAPHIRQYYLEEMIKHGLPMKSS
jgi:hypothetical protein